MNPNDHVNAVAIVDDHPATLRGVAAALESSASIKVVGTARSFHEFLEVLESTQTDVVFLDLVRIGVPAITEVTSLRTRYPDVKVIILSSDILGAHHFFQRYGVRGYVAKEDSDADVLQQAVHFVMHGQRYMSPSIMRKIASLAENLTPREIDVLQLLADGLSNEQIGHELSIATGTVGNIVSTLRRKLNLDQRTALAGLYRKMIGND